MTTRLCPELLPARGLSDKMRCLRLWLPTLAGVRGPATYSLRARNNEFRLEQIKPGIDEAHARGKSSL